MSSRWRRVATEVYRFAVVGGAATIVAVLIFNGLVHGYWYSPPLGNHVIWAYIIANTVGMAISYRGSRSWAFAHRPPRFADGGRTAYVVINIATMTLPIACLKFSRDVLGRTDPFSDNIAANVVGLGLGMVARYYLFRTLVFRKPEGGYPGESSQASAEVSQRSTHE